MEDFIFHKCENCQKPFTFKSNHTNIIVCSNCNSHYIKNFDENFKPNKEYNKPTQNYSRIKVGTNGKYKKSSFEIIGRLVCNFEEVSCNNWFMNFEDGSFRNLLEYQNHFIVQDKIDIPKTLTYQKLKSIGISNQKISKDKITENYVLYRFQKCKSLLVEGETKLFTDTPEFESFELIDNHENYFECISYKDNSLEMYQNSITSFEDFEFKNLNEIKIDANFIDCAGCKNQITLHSFPYAFTAVCEKCNKVNIKTNSGWKALYNGKGKYVPYIPIGSTGKIDSIEYRVVGFAIKCDGASYKWKEYTLYNSTIGFAYISEYNGHFILLNEVKKPLYFTNINADELIFEGESFAKYNKYTMTLVEAHGEFPSNIFDNSGVRELEFISPPIIYVREEDTTFGITWYRGRELKNSEIYSAFGNNISLPFKSGMGAVQTYVGFSKPNSLIQISLIALLLFFITHVFTLSSHEEREIINQTVFIPDSGNIDFVSEPFQLKKSKSNLRINFDAPVSNNWFEISGTVINTKTGDEVYFEKGVEYYYGYEGGESWSEGGQDDYLILSSLEKGEYILKIHPTVNSSNPVHTFNLVVINDVFMLRNFVWFLIFLVAPIYLLHLYIKYKESERWYDSPFSDYE